MESLDINQRVQHSLLETLLVAVMFHSAIYLEKIFYLI